MKILWSIIGAACMLPLSAADLPRPQHVPYTGEYGALICELTLLKCNHSISMLKKYALVNNAFNEKASEKLNVYRGKLKEHIKPLITKELDGKTHAFPSAYSPDGLEAVVVDASTGRLGFRTSCWITYYYYDSSAQIPCIAEAKGEFGISDNVNPKPFFTQNYLCCDLKFGLRSGIIWNRTTKVNESADFIICCGEKSGKKEGVSWAWVAQQLPKLYEKIIQHAYRYTETVLSYLEVPNKLHEPLEILDLAIDLAKMDLLTHKDIATLRAFSDADWSQIKNKSLQFLLFNMLACYGNLTTEMSPDKPQAGFLKQLDRCLGKQKIAFNESKDGSTSRFQVSRIYDAISFINSEGKEFQIVHDKSPYTDATNQYVTNLKNEGIFVEKEWDRDLKKRMPMWELAKAQHKKNRLRLKLYNDLFLMRYDTWSSRLTIVRPIEHSLMEILINKRVPRNIDVDSITVFRVSDAPPSSAEHYFAKPTDYRIAYNVNPHTENPDDAYDSDVLVESDDEQSQ
jgi:hypothetical protein